MAQLLTGALAQVDQARDQLRAGHPELAAGLGGRGGAGGSGEAPVMLGRVDIDLAHLLKRGHGAHDGWFEMDGGVCSLHLSLNHVLQKRGGGDESDDEPLPLPTNAVMLRIYCQSSPPFAQTSRSNGWIDMNRSVIAGDRVLVRRALAAWLAHARRRFQLRRLLATFLSSSQANMQLAVFEGWRIAAAASAAAGSDEESVGSQGGPWVPAPTTLLFPHNHREKAERRRRSLSRIATAPPPSAERRQMWQQEEKSERERIREMGTVWPAAWAASEVATVAHRLEEQATAFWMGRTLTAAFGTWHTRTVQEGAMRFAAQRRVSALLRAAVRRWLAAARAAREIYFAQAWYEEHAWHWIGAAAMRRWVALVDRCAQRRSTLEEAVMMCNVRVAARSFSCWRVVCAQMQALRDGCAVFGRQREINLARRALAAWCAWSGGAALLDGRLGAQAAAADIARQSGGGTALPLYHPRSRPAVHCFLTSLGEPRVVATHHHKGALRIPGNRLWQARQFGNALDGADQGQNLSLAVKAACVALPLRCWREYVLVRRVRWKHNDRVALRCRALRAFCALCAWRGVACHQWARDLLGARASAIWYRVWRGRVRCELRLPLASRHEWERFWAQVERAGGLATLRCSPAALGESVRQPSPPRPKRK